MHTVVLLLAADDVTRVARFRRIQMIQPLHPFHADCQCSDDLTAVSPSPSEELHWSVVKPHLNRYHDLGQSLMGQLYAAAAECVEGETHFASALFIDDQLS